MSQIKAVTSATFFHDEVGQRVSVTYSIIDEATGKIVSDNRRIDKVLYNADEKAFASQVEAFAQEIVDATE